MDEPQKAISLRLEGLKDRYSVQKFPYKGKIVIAIALLILAVILYRSCLVYVHPDEFGIKVVKLGAHRGVQKKIYGPGLYFVVPGMQQMHRLPMGVQVLELTNSPTTAALSSRQEKAAHIQTSDGFFVDVDVSILYRISDPYLVFTMIGPGTLYEDNGIMPKAEPILKATLGELTTEEFYNSPLRVKRTNSAKGILNRELNPKGIKVEEVMVRYFRYSKEIQKNIEEKKLKDQLVFKNRAEAGLPRKRQSSRRSARKGKPRWRSRSRKGKHTSPRSGLRKTSTYARRMLRPTCW